MYDYELTIAFKAKDGGGAVKLSYAIIEALAGGMVIRTDMPVLTMIDMGKDARIIDLNHIVTTRKRVLINSDG